MSPKGRDDLAACLLLLAEHHGITATKDALIAGLPLDDTLTPALFARAAERVGFVSRIVEAELDDLNPALLPAVLLLKDRHACIVHGIDPQTGTASVVFPELGFGGSPACCFFG